MLKDYDINKKRAEKVWFSYQNVTFEVLYSCWDENKRICCL